MHNPYMCASLPLHGYMHALIAFVALCQVLLKVAGERGLQLAQLGYQAIATSCSRQQEGLTLLEEMKVRNSSRSVRCTTCLLQRPLESVIVQLATRDESEDSLTMDDTS